MYFHEAGIGFGRTDYAGNIRLVAYLFCKHYYCKDCHRIPPEFNSIDYLNSISEKIASPLGTIMTTLGVIIGSIVGVSKWFFSQKKVDEKKDNT